MKILDVVKKLVIPGAGILLGTVITAKCGDEFVNNIFDVGNPIEDDSVEIEEFSDGSFIVRPAKKEAEEETKED